MDKPTQKRKPTKLEEDIALFLLTQDNTDEDSWYATNRELAEIFLTRFSEWTSKRKSNKRQGVSNA